MSGARWQMWPALGVVIALWVGVTMLIAACSGGHVIDVKPSDSVEGVLLEKCQSDLGRARSGGTWQCQCRDGWYTAPMGVGIPCCGDLLRGGE